MASKAMLAVLLAAAFLSSVAEGKRATVHAVEESRAGAVFDSFCFSEGGTLSIRVSNVKLGAAGEGEKQKRIGLIAQSNNEGAAISMDEFARMYTTIPLLVLFSRSSFSRTAQVHMCTHTRIRMHACTQTYMRGDAHMPAALCTIHLVINTYHTYSYHSYLPDTCMQSGSA
mmetsp:Transcript_38086/g.98341  ORF Transcript_38086/g.98341 Transcript_38086/m.98341 type:complete len:171 (-) Transcript_38086:1304-1816(-)